MVVITHVQMPRLLIACKRGPQVASSKKSRYGVPRGVVLYNTAHGRSVISNCGALTRPSVCARQAFTVIGESIFAVLAAMALSKSAESWLVSAAMCANAVTSEKAAGMLRSRY